MSEKLIPACSEQQISHPYHSEKNRLFSSRILPFVTLVWLLPVTIALLTSTIVYMQKMNHLEIELKTLRHTIESLELEYEPISNDDYHNEYDDDEDEMADLESITLNAKPNDTQSLHHYINGTTATHVRNRRQIARNESGQNKDREGRVKKIEAFHLQVDSSMYSMEIEHAGQTLNIWTTNRESRRSKFGEYQNNGRFRVRQRGLYYVYSQITYYDNSGRWCHAIKKNSNIIAKCLASEWGMSVDEGTNHYVPTVHNCFTATVTNLRPNDELSISSLYGRRTIHQGTDMTFWGIIKLA